MFIRKIVSVIAASFMVVSLAACQSETKETTQTSSEPVKILSPTGAPALALIDLYGKDGIEIETVEGADVLSAELAKTDGEYDIVVAPTNVGAKIYTQAKAYNLEAVLTWGNLFVVGEAGADLASVSLAGFGQDAVPGLVFSSVYDVDSMNITWYASVQEASQALLTGKNEAALLAQPVAAATIAKAKEQGKELGVLSDVQSMWQDGNGYPQASLFVKAGNKEKVANVLTELEDSLSNVDETTLESRIEEVGVETLGLPSAKLAASTWKQQNIRYEKAVDAKDSIVSFLNVFNMECPEGLIGD